MEHIQSLTVKNLRCFKDLTLDFKAPVVLIKGCNGSGKTTILEALSYSSTLRSFRTYYITELVSFSQPGFYIKVDISPVHTLKTVFSGKKRVIKFDEKVIKSHKEISSLYHAISLTEDDLAIVQDGPEARRTFLDQILVLTNAGYEQILKENKRVVEQRTSLLQQINFNRMHYDLWTQELFKKSHLIVEQRVELLTKLTLKVNNLLNTFINPILNKDFVVNLIYEPKHVLPVDNQIDNILFEQEKRAGRTLLGAHLDDIIINFQDKKSRSYASRGQQKLLVLVLKISALMLILDSDYRPDLLLFLLDDFLTDLDSRVAHALLKLISTLKVQMFITSPGTTTVVEDALLKEAIQFQEILL